jgi:hypothetical protein
VDEPVVDRLRRAVLSRRITPAQTVPDDEDDAADDPAVIDPQNSCDSGKYGSIRRICASDNQIRSLMATPSRAATQSTDRTLHNHFERFTMLYAKRIRFDANAHYSGSNVG